MEAGFIEKLESQIYIRDNWKESFWKITKRGAYYIGRDDQYKRGISKIKSPYNIFHESMIRDVAMSFLKLYPGYTVFISYDEVFKNKDTKLQPDFVVRLVKDGKTYCFLVEIERKRTFDKDKQDKYEKVFSINQGLPEKFRVLFVCASLGYNAFLRPTEYKDHRSDVDNESDHLNHFIKHSSALNEHRYRFLSFTDFYRLDEPIWKTTKGNKVSLI